MCRQFSVANGATHAANRSGGLNVYKHGSNLELIIIVPRIGLGPIDHLGFQVITTSSINSHKCCCFLFLQILFSFFFVNIFLFFGKYFFCLMVTITELAFSFSYFLAPIPFPPVLIYFRRMNFIYDCSPAILFVQHLNVFYVCCIVFYFILFFGCRRSSSRFSFP